MEARQEPSLPPPPALMAVSLLLSYSLESFKGRKNPVGGGGTLKRTRCYSIDGYGGSNSNSRIACRQANK